jgi:CheY-like chemotaxis protein
MQASRSQINATPKPTQRLLSAPPDLAIVAITAHCSSKDKRLSLESGMLAHLNKPFTLHQLQQILHRLQPSKGPPNRSAEGSP